MKITTLGCLKKYAEESWLYEDWWIELNIADRLNGSVFLLFDSK